MTGDRTVWYKSNPRTLDAKQNFVNRLSITISISLSIQFIKMLITSRFSFLTKYFQHRDRKKELKLGKNYILCFCFDNLNIRISCNSNFEHNRLENNRSVREKSFKKQHGVNQQQEKVSSLTKRTEISLTSLKDTELCFQNKVIFSSFCILCFYVS